MEGLVFGVVGVALLLLGLWMNHQDVRKDKINRRIGL